METLLPYELEIIEEALSEDSLNVLARGLCAEKIVSQLLKAFCVKTNLVLVVNASKEDIACFQDYLRDASISPRALTTDTTSSVTERVKIYKEGGVLFVTSRILILDFLTNRIPAEFITALLIYRAEKLLISHQVRAILLEKLLIQDAKFSFPGSIHIETISSKKLIWSNMCL